MWIFNYVLVVLTDRLKPEISYIDSDSDFETDSSDSEESSSEEDTALEELERKRKHPDRLHLELWFNDPKEVNELIIFLPKLC